MTTLADLLAQRSALEEKIAAVSKTERADAIAKIHALMQESGISLADLRGDKSPKGNAEKSKGGPAKKVAAKYKDGNGNSWSGRGLQPRWLKAAVAAGKKQEDFAV